MIDVMDPREAIARVPGWGKGDIEIEEQTGGLTNRNFKLTRKGENFMLRLDAEHTDAFGLDRVLELSIQRNASARQLAPEIVYADTKRGILISHFVNGRMWSADDLYESANIESLVELLLEVHELPRCGQSFNAVAIAKWYLDKLRPRRNLHIFGGRCVAIVENASPIRDVRCCHNDVVAANVITGKRLMLLDWEYACDNEPLFDLASIVGYHDLDQKRAELLLIAYAGGVSPELRERFAEQRRIYDALQWLWLAVRQSISQDAAQEHRLGELQKRIL